ncbi:MAG: hypothetical protein JJT76_00250 [Clostridiaceae bacterium]|nr:hypothetical protein [Clostridiaceae bacterium]
MKSLIEWVEEKGYDFGENQCLEKTIFPDKNPSGNTKSDLYCLVKMDK